MTPIFYLKNAHLNFADKHVLSDINLQIMPGDRVCLVGKNGCGKSSLMKIIEGEYEIDQGELFRDPAIKVGYLKQDMTFRQDCSIYDFVLNSLEGDPLENKYLADMIFEPLQINGHLLLSQCSGGQLRRAFLAASLVAKPDILLLDEPTNHLDIIAIEWLEVFLKSYQGAVICISHDRTFQENISNKVWWIDRSILRKSERGFKHYDHWREEILATEEAKLRNLGRKLEAEQGWLSTGVTARRKRNQQRLGNLIRLRETYKQQQSHLREAKRKLDLKLAEESKKSRFIIEAKNLYYNINGKNLVEDFSIKIKKGEKIGVIGPNGVGKSTLIRLLINELEPDSGKIRYGTNLEITYFDQHRSEISNEMSIKQILCPNGGDHVLVGDKLMHVAAYLKKFMFDPKSLDDKVATLSGGQASRLLLAKILTKPGNLLVLDEPTNDLDIDSLEMLLEILADYGGTLLIVSHDRDFLERLVTRSLVFDSNKIIDLYGGYQDYLKYYKKAEPVQPVSKKAKQPTSAKSSSNKLSYKYVRLLEQLPKEIDQLEHEIKKIQEKLSDGNLYLENNRAFNDFSQELHQKEAALDEKIEQLLNIEEMQDRK